MNFVSVSISWGGEGGIFIPIDEILNLKGHINKISNKISKSNLKKLKHIIPMKTKVLIYNSSIVTYLNFCILACMGLSV